MDFIQKYLDIVSLIVFIPIPLVYLIIYGGSKFDLWDIPFFTWLDSYPGNFIFLSIIAFMSVVGLFLISAVLIKDFKKKANVFKFVLDTLLVIMTILNLEYSFFAIAPFVGIR